jgi:hypothetical protein
MMKIDPRNIEIIDDQMVKLFQSASVEKKWTLASQMHKSLCLLLKEYLKSQNPDWTELQIEKEMAGRLGYGPD